MNHAKTILLRPGVTNKKLWNPPRPAESEWARIRKIVMQRDNWTCAACGHRAQKWMSAHHLEDSGNDSPENLVPLCVACHAVMHVGRSLMEKIVEVWKCELSQVEIVRQTRKWVKEGFTLQDIKAKLPLQPGHHPPNSTEYANELVRSMGSAPRAYLAEPLCAVFVNLTRWQIEEDESARKEPTLDLPFGRPGDTQEKDKLSLALEQSMKHDLPCCLCGQPTGNRGVFIPKDPKASHLGAPPKGKTRTVIYALCDKHPQSAATSESVERALAQHFTTVNN